MPTPGYVYALVNASMPGLVKVGRTERDPKDRAAELSGATGVATPFLVVYQEYFSDSEYAESWVHECLQHQGYRVSPNREFFNAETTDVIRAIAACEGKCTPEDALQLDENAFSTFDVSPGEDLRSQGDDYLAGIGDTIQDYDEALRCYEQAAKLGSTDALIDIGKIYEWGLGVRQNLDTALDYYKEAAKKGNNIGYTQMAGVYYVQGNEKNFQKCWSKYFQGAALQLETDENWLDTTLLLMEIFISQCAVRGWEIWPIPEIIVSNKDALLTRSREFARDQEERTRKMAVEKFVKCKIEHSASFGNFLAWWWNSANARH